MPFKIDDLQRAFLAYKQFQKRALRPYDERYIFPFFAGSYFAYRKVDVARIVAIANSISSVPFYIDVGCGYGDFLNKIREFIPDAIGIEKEKNIFFALNKPIPDYIYSIPIECFEKKKFDVAFVGWMEPGVDFRKNVAQSAKCVITTFDSGGQCGVNGGCEYDEFGFDEIAWWRTPSWIDVNYELMNRFYTDSIATNELKKRELAKFRSAHNFWYVYAKPEVYDDAKNGLKMCLEEERGGLHCNDNYDFESVLDECGFHYTEELMTVRTCKLLWNVKFAR